MANTLQTAMDLAKLPVNDDAGDRYTPAKLLSHCNHGLLTLYRVRPDLWMGDWDNVPTGNLAATTPLPIDDTYIQVLADYITARASMTDDEFISTGRIDLFLKLFGVQANG